MAVLYKVLLKGYSYSARRHDSKVLTIHVLTSTPYLLYDILESHFRIQSVSPVLIGLADVRYILKLMPLPFELQRFDVVGNC